MSTVKAPARPGRGVRAGGPRHAPGRCDRCTAARRWCPVTATGARPSRTRCRTGGGGGKARTPKRPLLAYLVCAAGTATVRLACRFYSEPTVLHASRRSRRPVR